MNIMNIMMIFMIIIMIFFFKLNIYIIKKKKNFCVYEKETYENNDIESIVDGIGTLWLNEKHIEEKLGHKNLPAITNKYDQVYKKHRYELVNEAKKQPNRRFFRSDLTLKVIMGCRTDESCNLKKKLGFRLHDVINIKEQTVLESIKKCIRRRRYVNTIQYFRLQDRSLLS